MPDQLVNMSSQFGGLPMDQLIGGPLKAACNAQTLLAKASSDFIKDVGLNSDSGGNMSARTVDFSPSLGYRQHSVSVCERGRRQLHDGSEVVDI